MSHHGIGLQLPYKLLLTSLLLTSHLVYAAVPHLIRYQGQAVDSQGVPLEGPYTLTFRLYDAETGGTKLWEEIQANVPLQGGHFGVLLGQVTPLAVMDWSRPCWISVQVGAEPELAPRQRITSVPMALMAERIANSGMISPINLLKDGSFESWRVDYPVLSEWEVIATVSAPGVVKKGTDQAQYGPTSAKLIHDGAGHHGNVRQRTDAVSRLRGQPVTLSAWALSWQPRQPCVQVRDGVTLTSSCLHPGDGTWQQLVVTHVVSPEAPYLEFGIVQTREGENESSEQPNYVDGAMAVAGPMPFAYSPSPEDAAGPISTNGSNVGIGMVNPTNILTIQQGSPTDPIADSWTVYPSDRRHKTLLRALGPREGRLEQVKAVELYEWTKRPTVSEEEAMCALGKREPAAGELETVKGEIARRKAGLRKFSAKRVGMAIDDANVPREVLAFNEDGATAGIDLLAYVGYLHAALKEAALKLDELESRVDPRSR